MHPWVVLRCLAPAATVVVDDDTWAGGQPTIITMVSEVYEYTPWPAWLLMTGLPQLLPWSVLRAICPVITPTLSSAGLQHPKSNVEFMVSSSAGHHHD